jgi:hypothetical protein
MHRKQKLVYFVLGAVTGVILAVAGLFWLESVLMIEDVIVQVEVPDKVAQGEEFTFTVSVQNVSDGRTKLLDSIDVGDNYLKGIEIMRTEPQYTEKMHVPLVNVYSYDFMQDILPGEELRVRFHAVAQETGTFISELDVYIDGGRKFTTSPLGTVVRP